jgi:hypothetical protein
VLYCAIRIVCHVVLCFAVLWCSVLCCALLCCSILCCVVLYCGVLYCAVLCCIVVCYTVLSCAVLCCDSDVLCCDVVCCAVLCYAVLYCAVLCCIVLWYTVLYCAVLCCGVMCCVCAVRVWISVRCLPSVQYLFVLCCNVMYVLCGHLCLMLWLQQHYAIFVSVGGNAIAVNVLSVHQISRRIRRPRTKRGLGPWSPVYGKCIRTSRPLPRWESRHDCDDWFRLQVYCIYSIHRGVYQLAVLLFDVEQIDL